MNAQSDPHVRQGDAHRPLIASRLSRRALLSFACVTLLGGIASGGAQSKDPLQEQAMEIVARSHLTPSVALIQRRLKINYKRALRLVDGMKVIS